MLLHLTRISTIILAIFTRVVALLGVEVVLVMKVHVTLQMRLLYRLEWTNPARMLLPLHFFLDLSLLHLVHLMQDLVLFHVVARRQIIVTMPALDKAVLINVVLHVSDDQIRMLAIKRTHLTFVAFSFPLVLECSRRILFLLGQAPLWQAHFIVRVQNLVLLQIQSVRGVVVAVATLDRLGILLVMR